MHACMHAKGLGMGFADAVQPKIRLYCDSEGKFKGDCLLSFVHEASVETAIRYFDNYAVTDTHTIRASTGFRV